MVKIDKYMVETNDILIASKVAARLNKRKTDKLKGVCTVKGVRVKWSRIDI